MHTRFGIGFWHGLVICCLVLCGPSPVQAGPPTAGNTIPGPDEHEDDPMDRFVDDGDEAYLGYAVPAELGAEPMRYERRPILPYSRRFVDPETGAVIAIERFDKEKKLRQRELFLNGDLHGIQRRWHANGVLSQAHPYKHGVRHGRFQEWADEGQLVCNSALSAGTGVINRYHRNGVLEETMPYERNRRHGNAVKLYENGQMTYDVQYTRGNAVGTSLAFYENGAVRSVAFTDKDGKLQGPIVEWRQDKTHYLTTYFLHDRPVTPEEYRAARAADKTLPKPVNDPASVLKRVLSKTMLRKIEAYKQAEPVEIPLASEGGGRGSEP